jgi:hypothetical protein
MDMPIGYNRTRETVLLSVAFLCFFLSGSAGLIYEVVWTRMLTQIFGNTTYAIATVLAAFMAGLRWGAMSLGVSPTGQERLPPVRHPRSRRRRVWPRGAVAVSGRAAHLCPALRV